MHFTSSNFETFDKSYRANFFNSLNGFKSICLCGTISENGIENVAIFSSIFHLGSNPPLFGMTFRPNQENHQTLNNILATKYYTLNHINESFYKNAHQTSAKYDHFTSEFDACGLTPAYKNNLKAPFVAESNVQIGLEFVQKIDLEINGTTLVIGSIKEVWVDDKNIHQDGFIDLEALGSLTSTGSDAYFKTQKIARLSYAKVGKEIEIIG